MDIEFYKNLIPVKNYSKFRYMQYLEAVLKHGLNMGGMLEAFELSFDLNNAVGPQLDFIASYVGATRKFPLVPIPGYDEYLSDDTFRIVIQARIMQNYWDGTNGSFQDIWDATIGQQFVAEYVDNQDMSINVNIDGTVEPYMTELILAGKIVPKPSGVMMYVVITQRSETNHGAVPDQLITFVGADSAHIGLHPDYTHPEVGSDSPMVGSAFHVNNAEITVRNDTKTVTESSDTVMQGSAFPVNEARITIPCVP